MKTNQAIVHEWYQAWIEQDDSKLNLTKDFHHISPHGEYNSRDAFLEACWGKMGDFKMEIRDEVVQGDTVVVWYESVYPGGSMPICEWIKLRGGQISEIRVFYDTGKS